MTVDRRVDSKLNDGVPGLAGGEVIKVVGGNAVLACRLQHRHERRWECDCQRRVDSKLDNGVPGLAGGGVVEVVGRKAFSLSSRAGYNIGTSADGSSMVGGRFDGRIWSVSDESLGSDPVGARVPICPESSKTASGPTRAPSVKCGRPDSADRRTTYHQGHSSRTCFTLETAATWGPARGAKSTSPLLWGMWHPPFQGTSWRRTKGRSRRFPR